MKSGSLETKYDKTRGGSRLLHNTRSFKLWNIDIVILITKMFYCLNFIMCLCACTFVFCLRGPIICCLAD